MVHEFIMTFKNVEDEFTKNVKCFKHEKMLLNVKTAAVRQM